MFLKFQMVPSKVLKDCCFKEVFKVFKELVLVENRSVVVTISEESKLKTTKVLTLPPVHL